MVSSTWTPTPPSIPTFASSSEAAPRGSALRGLPPCAARTPARPQPRMEGATHPRAIRYAGDSREVREGPGGIGSSRVCDATAKVLSRQTAYEPSLASALVRACAEACSMCAEECARHAGEHRNRGQPAAQAVGRASPHIETRIAAGCHYRPFTRLGAPRCGGFACLPHPPSRAGRPHRTPYPSAHRARRPSAASRRARRRRRTPAPCRSRCR